MLVASLLLLAPTGLGPVVWASPSDEVREQLLRIVVDERLQTTLRDPEPESRSPVRRMSPERLEPEPARPPEPTPEPETEPQRERPRPTGATPTDASPPPSPPNPPDDGLSFGEVFLWLLAAGVAALAVVFLAAVIRRTPSAKAGQAKGPRRGGAPVPGAALPDAPYDEAEALAAAGRFDDAVHLLLLRALRLLSGASGAPAHPSETSREVLARLHLAPGARRALTYLVDAVEISRFGGRPLDERAWRGAREAWNAGRPGADPA